MNDKSFAVAVLLAVVGVAVFGLAVSLAPPPVVGADGSEQVGTVIPWTDLLKALGGGSILTSILAFFGKIKPFVGPVLDVVHTIPSPPKPDADPQKDADQSIEKDTVELVAAVIAYAKNRDDKKLQQRLIGAVCVEIRDMIGFKSPAIQSALNSLMIAMSNVLVPAPVAADTGVKP